MRRYGEAVKADVRRRMSLLMRQSVSQISAELGIRVVTLYNWRVQRCIKPLLPEWVYSMDFMSQWNGTAGCRAIYQSTMVAFVTYCLRVVPPPIQ